MKRAAINDLEQQGGVRACGRCGTAPLECLPQRAEGRASRAGRRFVCFARLSATSVCVPHVPRAETDVRE
jgi:hypothetical protein